MNRDPSRETENKAEKTNLHRTNNISIKKHFAFCEVLFVLRKPACSFGGNIPFRFFIFTLDKRETNDII